MTRLDGLFAVRRLSVLATTNVTQQQRGAQRAGDTFAATPVNHNAFFQESVLADGTHVLRADGNHRTTTARPDASNHSHVTAVHADAVAGTAQALSQVRETATQALERANATVSSGDAMSHDAAVAKVVEIYSAAFPGIGFTEGELAGAIAMLQSGKVSPEEMKAGVQEGARLINDPDAMADQARERFPLESANRRSVVSQQLRMERLAALMQKGYLPEGKFNVAGGFSFCSPGGLTTYGQYIGALGVGGTQSGAAGQPSSSATTTSSGLRSGGAQLIQGAATNQTAPILLATVFGDRANNQVSLSGATSSSLSQAASELSDALSKTGSPVMLDLNHDGRLGVTGNSTAKDRADNVVNAKVDFDLDGDGKKERIEWMNGDGDGMLVDDRDGGATAAMRGNGEISGTRLFGDEGGKYANGYEKMKALDTNGDGKLTGHELDGLKTWIDDGDAKIEEGELKTMAELGVTSIDLKMQLTANDRGEQLMRSTFTQNGVEHVSEDVWFAEQAHLPNLAAMTARVTEQTSGGTLAALVARIDSTLEQLDDVSRQVDQRRSITALTNHAHQAMLANGLRG